MNVRCRIGWHHWLNVTKYQGEAHVLPDDERVRFIDERRRVHGREVERANVVVDRFCMRCGRSEAKRLFRTGWDIAGE